MFPTAETLLEKTAGCPAPPVALEVFWDGDTSGWYLVLTLVYQKSPRKGQAYGDYSLAAVSGSDGDLRIFNGQVPPWPEALWASEVGQELAAQLGVPFYFPSPSHPEDDCPRWWQRGQGYPCRRCGIPLLQKELCPWRGVCHFCHLAEERERREAEWTAEERAGPRCEMCGGPAKGTLGTSLLCSDCLERYEDYQCSRCGVTTRISKTLGHTDLCTRCDVRSRLDQLPETGRDALRQLLSAGRRLEALDEIERVLEVSLSDAVLVISGMCQ